MTNFLVVLPSGKKGVTDVKTVNSQSLLGTGNVTILPIPAGSDKGVQFNDGGVQNSEAGFEYDKTTNVLLVGNGYRMLNTGVGQHILRPTGSAPSGNSAELRTEFDSNNCYASIELIANDESVISEYTQVILTASADTANHVAAIRLSTQLAAPMFTHKATYGTTEKAILHEGNVKTVSGQSIYGSGNITVSASPAGSNTQVQYNNASTMAGSADFTWNNTTKVLQLISSGSLKFGSTVGWPVLTKDGLGRTDGSALYTSSWSDAASASGNDVWYSDGSGGGIREVAILTSTQTHTYRMSTANTTLTLTLTGTALDGTHNFLHSGNTKTINGNSLYGAGNLTISAAPAGSNTQVQYNNSGVSAGATATFIEAATGRLNVGTISAYPAYGLGGSIGLGKSKDALNVLASVDAVGFGTVYGGDPVRSMEFGWRPVGNGTTLTSMNATALTAVGTPTTATMASGSALAYANRIEYLVTAAATAAIASLRHAVSQLLHGYTTSYGGYKMTMYFGIATGTSNATRRAFFGVMSSTAAQTDVNPSTLLNVIGVGYDSSDTNWQIITNNASGSATKSSTGMARPTSDRQDLYRLDLTVSRLSFYAMVSLTNVTTGASSEQYPTDIPAATTLMNLNCYVSAGGTSAVVGIIFAGAYFQKNLSDYQ